MTSWLGLDIGTSSLKAVLLNSHGEVIASSRSAYETTYQTPGIAEQDPRDYLRAAAEAIGDLGVDTTEIGGVGLSGQTPTAVLVDSAGDPVRPAMTWQDSRAAEEAAELAESTGSAMELFGTQLAWSPTAIPAKLLWLARHETDTVAATRWVLQPKDYLGLALTGVPTSDPWSSKGLCNVLSSAPVGPFLEKIGWSVGVCPPIAPAWVPRGPLTDHAAEVFGLPVGVPVSVGWSDALAAMLGVGAFTHPSAFILTGTSDIVGRTFDGDAPAVPGLMTIPRQCAPLSATYGPTQSSGSSVEWLARVLAKSVAELMELEPVLPGNVPIFVPYIRGERAPLWSDRVRAGFSGICAEHGAGDLVDGVLQGISLGARHILEAMGPDADDDVHIAGVSATIDRWTRARLQTLGRPLVLHPEQNTSAIGAAILAASSAGNDLDDEVERVVRSAHRKVPGDDVVARSARLYASFLRLSGFAVAEAAS